TRKLMKTRHKSQQLRRLVLRPHTKKNGSHDCPPNQDFEPFAHEAENFRSTGKSDFFNNIDPNRK
ncbi:MAG: hypothetical protein QGF20_16465, partial [Alphaproteobacteria bacterium]|nr:hypothetical protein [Alphaproteobacteria bacterium]